ncbi:hypothetical protein RRG08_027726 [Elysia crispata]|uniref:Calx-beta domain-containing protein n=1 Tax=Elysia crispata TaxID=231223 RepID=A0AAE0XMJ8_9GAST|nr:hypothetical protein RRG08_027726 [Elysia crispata]
MQCFHLYIVYSTLSSAPEILLNVIEIVGHTFKAGELGPGTIVGSAAFNLFIITGICILSIPAGDVRKIRNLRVFAVTSCFGVLAYVWMTMVLLVITPERVDLWEAVLTLLLFPALICSAYVADKGPCCRSNKTGSGLEIGLNLEAGDPEHPGTADIINVAREVARDQNLNEDEAARAMAAKIARDRPKPSGWYRVNATRVITGGHRLVPKANHTFDDLLERVRKQSKEASAHNGSLANGISEKNGTTALNGSAVTTELTPHPGKATVEFTTATCAVLENEGYVRIGVKRTGDMNKEIKVGVETIDGTAQAVEDYKPINQLLTFREGESSKDVYIEIVDDDVWEPDEFFFVKLYRHHEGSSESDLEIGKLAINQVTIVNDDEPGKLEFSKPSYIIKESVESAQLTINRINGADGEVKVHWKTQDMSAVSGREYKGGQGTVLFKHGETSQILTLDVYGIVDSKLEPNFQVQLSDPTGGAELGKIPKTIVTIINDEEFNNMLSRIANKTQQNLDGLRLDSGSWREQFHCAMNVNGGDVDQAETLDYVMHFLTFFWKVLFAFIPPTSVGGGWLTFLCSLLMIGLLTAVVSDLASIFGCLIGLSDTITAITFVALGTSMPDTFASRSAAINERWADSSIGNINGSNSVNVFLGLGLPWLLATIYWEVKGEKFLYPTGSLSMTVTLFTVFAVICLSLLVCRRRFDLFGKAELGGTRIPKIVSACICMGLWVIYIVMSSLQAQGIINASF